MYMCRAVTIFPSQARIEESEMIDKEELITQKSKVKYLPFCSQRGRGYHRLVRGTETGTTVHDTAGIIYCVNDLWYENNPGGFAGANRCYDLDPRLLHKEPFTK